jgi:predicted DNA-binding transcriptional regulator YafY
MLGIDKMSAWTFVTNHTTVLLRIAQSPRITAREIADSTGISERAIRKIIADLDREHYISKKREGRNVVYTVYDDAKLRHGFLSEITVGELLEAIGWQKAPKEEKIQVVASIKKKFPFHIYQATEREQESIDNIYSQLI